MIDPCNHDNEELSDDGWTVFCKDCFEILNGEPDDCDDMVEVVVGFDLVDAWECHTISVPAMWTDEEIRARIHDGEVEWMSIEDNGCSSMIAREVHR